MGAEGPTGYKNVVAYDDPIIERLREDAALLDALHRLQREGLAEATSLLLHEADADALVFATCVGPSADKLRGRRQPLSQGITATCFSFGMATAVNDTQADPSHDPSVDRHTGVTTGSLMATPVESPKATWGAVTAINSGRPDGFSADDLRVQAEVADALADRLDALAAQGELTPPAEEPAT